MNAAEIRDLETRAALALRIEGLVLALSAHGAASAKDHRLFIRKALAADLGRAEIDRPGRRAAPSEELSRILDLNVVPVHSKFSISVSHCPSIGGYARVPLPTTIGFDIEEKARVRDAIAERVRNGGDETAPSSAHLWGAKEAVFKCLFLSQQPKISTDISIHSWTRNGPNETLFRARRSDSVPDPEGYGVVLETETYLLCFFRDSSQLKSATSDRLNITRE